MNIFPSIRDASLGLICALAIELSWASTPLALDAPAPPTVLYRVDARDPAPLFNQGVQPWASLRDTVPNIDLLAHIYGEGQGNSAGPASNWVSTSHDMNYIRYWLAQMASSANPPRSYWVYEIQPNELAYSVRWALTEYLVRNILHASDRINAVQIAHDRAADYSEWAFFGGVPTADLLRATRWDYNPVEGNYAATGVTILNPHFSENTLPAPRLENPLDTFASDRTVAAFVYHPGVNVTAATRGTMAESLPWSMSCAGAPQSTTSSSSSMKGSDPTVPCTADQGQIKKYIQASKSRPSMLAFEMEGGGACLAPVTYNGYVGAGFVDCDANAPRFEYDEFKRLSVNWKKNHWCLAAPESVVTGGKPYWDYVQFEPCAVNASGQKWSIRNGQVYSYQGNLRLQEYGGSGMLSQKNDGRPMRINKAKFAFGFFNAPSPARSHQVELQMAWTSNGQTFYSNFKNNAPWGNIYWNRSYYDYNKQTISHIYLGSSSSASSAPPVKYCLSSQQFEGQQRGWRWTAWVTCNDSDLAVPLSSQWSFSSKLDSALSPSQLHWWDMARDPLWVDVSTNKNAGAYFTSFSAEDNYSTSSTREFSIRPDALRFGPRYAPTAVTY